VPIVFCSVDDFSPDMLKDMKRLRRPLAPGSGSSFALLGVDMRRYVTILPHHVLAGGLLYRQSMGEAPFYFRPDFGGNFVGRGFQASRFIGELGLRTLTTFVAYEIGNSDDACRRLAGYLVAMGFTKLQEREGNER